MPSTTSISCKNLIRLIGTPNCPVLINVCNDEDFDAHPYAIPGSFRRDFTQIQHWATDFAGQSVVTICQRGLKLSEGAAAWLRHEGAAAENLEGGVEAWLAAGHPMVPVSKMPESDPLGRTLWVTRARPKIDRIACPWLIRRFIDPSAVFLFVASSEVEGVAARFNATPFDVENVFWSHRDEGCTFDTMLAEFGLTTEPLLRLASIVRGADTGRPELAPEAAGLLAASLGLSRMYTDDLEQLDAGMGLYDAFYRWCRDAMGETHDWHTAASRPVR